MRSTREKRARMGGFSADAKLDEFARELAPLGIREVEVREKGKGDARRVVVVVRYGEHGIARSTRQNSKRKTWKIRSER